MRPTRLTSGKAVTEDRLRTAIERVARGTYTPGAQERALGFATDDGDGDGSYAYGMGCACGATGDDGLTASRYHLAGCDEAMSADEQVAVYKSSGAYAVIAAEPFTDAHGRTWQDQQGQPMTAADHLEALTGVRQSHRDIPFAGSGLERRELAAPQRVTRFGDYDAGDPGEELSADSSRDLRALAAALGLPDHAAARGEKRNAAWDHLVQRPPQRYRTYGEQMDYGGETTRDRAHRHKRGGSPVQVNDPVLGELPVYAAE
jgi:hypothetical protein